MSEQHHQDNFTFPMTVPERRLTGVEGDFATFYAATFSSLCAQLYVHTGDLAEAQDLVQEAFTRALPRWSQLTQYDDPAAWVRKVAWNLATSRWRRMRAFADFASRHRENHAPPPTPDRVVLEAALAKLSPRQRQAVILYYLADASVAEIAQIANANENTVKTWLHRGRAVLAGLLSEDVTPDV